MQHFEMPNSIEDKPQLTSSKSTKEVGYADRLKKLQEKGWKKYIRFIDPYGIDLRRLNSGMVLEVGCGIGRNLSYLKGKGVGIDHNRACVHRCISHGYHAFTPDDFRVSEWAGIKFDTLLLSHVLEHMTMTEGTKLIQEYLKYLKSGAKIILITPQEVGFCSDETHKEFIDFRKLNQISANTGLKTENYYSFPFPRFFGKFFIYNEFRYIGLFQP